MARPRPAPRSWPCTARHLMRRPAGAPRASFAPLSDGDRRWVNPRAADRSARAILHPDPGSTLPGCSPGAAPRARRSAPRAREAPRVPRGAAVLQALVHGALASAPGAIVSASAVRRRRPLRCLRGDIGARRSSPTRVQLASSSPSPERSPPARLPRAPEPALLAARLSLLIARRTGSSSRTAGPDRARSGLRDRSRPPSRRPPSP